MSEKFNVRFLGVRYSYGYCIMLKKTTVGVWITDQPGIQIMNVSLIIEWSIIQILISLESEY